MHCHDSNQGGCLRQEADVFETKISAQQQQVCVQQKNVNLRVTPSLTWAKIAGQKYRGDLIGSTYVSHRLPFTFVYPAATGLLHV